MSSLIVDFPPTGTARPKRVRFATESEIAFYALDDGSRSLHYSKQDFDEFKAASRQAVLNIQAMALTQCSDASVVSRVHKLPKRL